MVALGVRLGKPELVAEVFLLREAIDETVDFKEELAAEETVGKSGVRVAVSEGEIAPGEELTV